MLFLLMQNPLFAQISDTITASGTWTPPACVNSIDVQMWGAGGAGGGEPNALIALPAAGGGGGGGAYSKVTSIPVVSGTNYNIIVGTGGNAGVGDGQDGQASSATFGATTVTANGGKGGKTGNNGAGGAGGAAGVGGTAGGNGFAGEDSGILIAEGHGGGGGGGGGTTPGGNAAANGVPGNGGAGNINGDGGLGADPNLLNALFQTNGAPGEAYGGGGGGGNSALIAVSGLAGTADGGDGADGAVIITYFVGGTPTMTSSIAESVCSGGTVNLSLTADAGASFTWVAGDNPNITGESTTQQTSSTITDVLSNSNTTDEVVTYTVIPTATIGGCVGLPQTVSITVSPEPILSSTLTPPDICSAETFTYTPTSDAPSPTFTWTRAAVPGIAEAGGPGSGSAPINKQLTNTTSNPVDVVYIYTTTDGDGCVGPPENVTVSVNPESSLSLSSAVGTDGQTACGGDPIISIEYALGGVASGATVVGLPTGVSGAISAPSIYTISGTPTVKGTYDYTITTTGGCGADSTTGNITIGNILSSSAGTDTQNVCKNAPIADIVYAISGSGATTLGLPTGVTGVLSNPGVYTISGTPTTEGAYSYTVVNTGSCTVDSTFGLLVVGGGVITKNTDFQKVCKGDSIVNINYTIVGGDTPPPIVAGLPTGVTGAISSPGIFTISGVPTEEGSFDYSVTTQGGGCGDESTLTGNISVGVFLTSGAGTDTQSVCNGDPIIDIVYGFVGDTIPGPPSVIGLPPGVSGIATDTNTFTISGTPTQNGSYTYTISTNGSCGTQSSTTGRIIVGLGLVVGGTDTQSVCKNEPIVAINYNFGGNVPTVSNLPAGLTSAETSPGILTISGTPTEEGRFEYLVTSNGCFVPDTLYGSLTVGMGLINSGSDNQAVCNGSPIVNIDYEIVGGDVPPPTVSGLPAGVTGAISSPGVFTISGTPTIDGLYNYTLTSDTTAGCGSLSVLTGSIAVGMQLTSAVGTDSQNVCNNSPIVNITYAFAGDTIPGPPSITGSFPPGVTGAVTSSGVYTISGTPTAEGVYSYTLTTNGSCPVQSSLSGLIDVGAGLSLVSANDTQNICKTEPILDIEYSFVGGGTPTLSGQPNGVTGSVTAPNVFTVSGTPLNEGAYVYTVSSQGACPNVSILKGRITIGIGVTVPGSDQQSICEGDSILPIDYTIVGGDVPPPSVSGLPPGVTGSFTSPGIYTLSGTPTAEGTYSYTVATDTTGTCPVQSFATGTIRVGVGVVTIGTDTQSVCSGDPIIDIVYEFMGGKPPTVTGLPSGINASTTSSSEITISGSSTEEGVFNYIVTSDTTGGCPIQSIVGGQITIGSGIVNSLLDTQMVCKNEAITDIVISYSGGAIPVVSGLPSGVTDSVTGPNEITISGTPTQEGKFTYSVSTSGCLSSSDFNGTLVVGLGVVTDGTDTQSVCNGDPIIDIAYFVVGGDVPEPIILGLPTGVTGSITSPGIYTISGTPSTEGLYTYTLTTQGAGCGTQSSVSGTIAVGIQLLSATGTDTQSVCKTEPITNIVYAFAGGNSPAPTISGSLPSGVTGKVSSNGIYTISGTPTTAGAYTYTLTSQGSCSSPSSMSGRIIVGIGVLVPGADTQAVCKNQPITNIDYQIVGGDTPKPSVIGLPAGLSGSISSPGVYTISGTPTEEGSFFYSVSTQGGGCVEESTVSGRIVVGLGVVSPGTEVQTVCTNSPIGDIEYIVAGGNTPPPTVTGLPTGVSGSFNADGLFVISGTPQSSGVYTYTISSNTTAGCPVQSILIGTLTVQNTTITLLSGLDSQYICTGSAIETLKYTIGGTGDGATLTGSPAGLNGVYNNGVFTIDGKLDSVPVGPYTFTVTPTGSCVQGSAVFTITNLRPIARFVANYYSGSTPLDLSVFNTSKYANTYEWYFDDGVETDTSTNSKHTFEERGIYNVRLVASQDSLCNDTAYAKITAYHFEVPTIFTPNDDNINDFLFINEIGMDSLVIDIYNRWGVRIAGWIKPGGFWDGYNENTGQPSPDGTYLYVIRARDMDDGLYIQKGSILLIRK